jgi:hypothetical protein
LMAVHTRAGVAVARGRLEQCAGHTLGALNDGVRRAPQRHTADHGAARREGAAAERHLRRVVFISLSSVAVGRNNGPVPVALRRHVCQSQAVSNSRLGYPF